LQLQTTISLKRNTFTLDCAVQHNFNANHVPMVFEKDNSIQTLIYPVIIYPVKLHKMPLSILIKPWSHTGADLPLV